MRVMNNQKDHKKAQPSDDLPEDHRLVRFKARRAIINAIKQAKVTDGSFKNNVFICKFPRNHALKHFFNELAD